MLDLDGIEYVIAFWYVRGRIDQVDSDWFAVAYRATKESHPMLIYRHRYYRSSDVFDGADEKNWYRFSLKDGTTDDDAIETVSALVKETLIDRGFCGTRLPWKLKNMSFHRVIKGTPKDFHDVLVTMPFAHMRKATDEEVAEIDAERNAQRKKQN